MAATAPLVVKPVLDRIFRGHQISVGFRFWDGSSLGPADAKATIVLRSPIALRRILYAPGELGFGRAYVAGELLRSHSGRHPPSAGCEDRRRWTIRNAGHSVVICGGPGNSVGLTAFPNGSPACLV